MDIQEFKEKVKELSPSWEIDYNLDKKDGYLYCWVPKYMKKMDGHVYRGNTEKLDLEDLYIKCFPFIEQYFKYFNILPIK